ncbi:MAG: hypothetical protein ABIN44_12750 [Burkholderiaceae bacterium]
MTLKSASRALLGTQPGFDFIAWESVFVPDVPITFGSRQFLSGASQGGLPFKLIHPANLIVRTQGSAADQWDGDFVAGDMVLFTDNEPGPIVLLLDQPVRGLGVNMQANVMTNKSYAVLMKVFVTGGGSKPFPGKGTMQHLGTGLAPFLGALSSNADIVRAEFHVAPLPGKAGVTDLDLAINRVELVQ